MTDQDRARQADQYLRQTTISYPEWLRRVKRGVYTPPDGSQTNWGQALTLLDEIANPPAPTPPVQAAGGVGLYALGDGPTPNYKNLAGYAWITGPWPSLGFLNTLPASVERHVYTVVAGTGGADPSRYTVLDPANPQTYIKTCLDYVAGKAVGIFLDNTDLEIPGLTAAVVQAGDAIRAAGHPFSINLGSYVSGNPDSDTGALWCQRVALLGPHVSSAMLENWLQFSGGPLQGQLRTDGNGGNASRWLHCPAAAVAAGTRMVAVTEPPVAHMVYGRAGLLTSVGGESAVFAADGTAADPFDAAWATGSPQPVFDPVRGTASL